MTQRFLISIEYDGAPFVGWQRQANGISVQQVIEEAASQLCGHAIQVQGAGRTDSGVHATGQVAHLDLPEKFDKNRVIKALNALMGDWPVTILQARAVEESIHARFSATSRKYLYRILARQTPPALALGRVWHHPQPLDAAAMQQAASRLLGKHDFTSFRATRCQAESATRTLDELRIEIVGAEIHLHVAARSFLHHQVRNITGTLALVGAGKWSADDVSTALAARDRSVAGPTAPAEGLYLSRVNYAGINWS